MKPTKKSEGRLGMWQESLHAHVDFVAGLILILLIFDYLHTRNNQTTRSIKNLRKADKERLGAGKNRAMDAQSQEGDRFVTRPFAVTRMMESFRRDEPKFASSELPFEALRKPL